MLHRAELDRFEAGNVSSNADDLSAISAQFVDNTVELFGTEVRQDDLHPFGQEAFAHGLSDTTSSTGDDRYFALEFFHDSPSDRSRTLVGSIMHSRHRKVLC